jgi:hypothetical protein
VVVLVVFENAYASVLVDSSTEVLMREVWGAWAYRSRFRGSIESRSDLGPVVVLVVFETMDAPALVGSAAASDVASRICVGSRI